MNLVAQGHRSKEWVLKRLMPPLQYEDTSGGTMLQVLLGKKKKVENIRK